MNPASNHPAEHDAERENQGKNEKSPGRFPVEDAREKGEEDKTIKGRGLREKGATRIKGMSRNGIRVLRMTVMATVTGIIVIGAARGAGTGSLSAFGIKDISAVCPLGYLETAIAGRAVMPRLLIGFLVIAGLTALLGRVFCAWICPVPLARRLLAPKADEHGKQLSVPENTPPAPKSHFFSGLPVLGATLASTAVFGFPVFCLVCPIGLTFALLFALTRLLQFNEPTLDLIIFPAIIILELVFLRKWCSKWCPLGALLSLFSRFNRRLVPTVDPSLCLEESRHTRCQICRGACSLDIDLKSNRGSGDIRDCTKCGECGAGCPARAIRFPWKKR